jgi:transcription initiation factor TFIID subunit 10
MQQQQKPSSSLSDNDKDLLELLSALDSFNPIIPDALLDYHFTRAGLQCDDARLKKLVALVAQKFVTDVASDAMAHQRLRSGGRSSQSGTGTAKKTLLNMEDLTAALAERGIEIKRPFYHI